MGVERYIEQQLNPGKISDALAESKVKDLSTLSMSTAQLYEKYPQPGQLIRQLQRRGDLPDDLAAARQNRGKASESQTPGQPASGASMMPEAMPRTATESNVSRADSVGAGRNNEEYRRIIRDYYLQNGLQQPQRITAELQASRILRAVYSERYALTQLVRLAPEEHRYGERLAALGGAAQEADEEVAFAMEPDLAGYEILWRDTAAAVWTNSRWVGNVTSYTMKGLSKDNFFFGVRSIDKQGNRSPVSFPRPLGRTAPAARPAAQSHPPPRELAPAPEGVKCAGDASIEARPCKLHIGSLTRNNPRNCTKRHRTGPFE
jgi:hypothetical protein